MRTLIIDNYDSFTHNLAHYIGAMNGTAPTVVRNDEPGWELSMLEAYDNVVISPGPGNPAEADDFGICTEIIRHAQIPVLGVCLGHQGICHVHGARVTSAPEIFHGRESLVVHDGDELFAGVPSPFKAVRYHSLIATDLPPELEATAWTEDGILMAVRHRERPLWGVQFHPESIGTDHGRRILRNFMRLTRQRSRRSSSGHASSGIAKWQVEVQKLPFEVSTEVAFAAMYAAAPHAFWLDSSSTGELGGRFTFMGDASGALARVVEAHVDRRQIVVSWADGREVVSGSFLDWLHQDLTRHRIDAPRLPFDFTLGWVGYLGYELKAECGGEARHRSPYPDASMIFADRAVVFDHELHEIYLLALVKDADATSAKRWLERTRRRLEEIADQDEENTADTATVPASPGSVDEWRLRHDRERYLELIAACHKEIEAGESYEICLTNMLHGRGNFDPWLSYQHLRRRNPVPFGALLKFGGLSVLSSSPERFLRVGGNGEVESKPIKGTRPRSDDPVEDERLRSDLARDPKDRAENLMIVDLVRHDLSQCAETGSVRVDPLFSVESYATVHQLVSTVLAQLRPDSSAVHCARAAFPPGSMTGAPKVRTMQIIDRLEEGPRGIYSGALGYFSLSGAADLSVVIRTMVMTDDQFSFGTGGAITSLSEASAEFEETSVKAAPVLNLFNGRFPVRDDEVVAVRTDR
ncbi:aminodeoxychorismate synthase component I [Streptomyces sp. MB09-02B]|uniref:aminodeoxychorismate synthase component I n=1 Tax=Streptomyces sp. MB09-02B TaxID=3028667 RepID=UPI0029B8EE9A|nr:aminodeoxychorismate synthase component I [Streptomyces sp. MB09-02B]MDX3638428.1 aminodeoxychorismate synthase component I [Streptomyces sp. MB09-02B]